MLPALPWCALSRAVGDARRSMNAVRDELPEQVMARVDRGEPMEDALGIQDECGRPQPAVR